MISRLYAFAFLLMVGGFGLYSQSAEAHPWGYRHGCYWYQAPYWHVCPGDRVYYGRGPQGDRECRVTEVYEDGSAYVICQGWDGRARGFVQNPQPKQQCYKNICVDDYVLADLRDFTGVCQVARISAEGRSGSASVKVVLYHVDGNSKNIFQKPFDRITPAKSVSCLQNICERAAVRFEHQGQLIEATVAKIFENGEAILRNGFNKYTKPVAGLRPIEDR